MKRAYVTKNLWNYETINPVPENLPEGMDPYYITDTKENCDIAASLGWTPVLYDEYKDEKDRKRRRSVVIMINAYPERFIHGYMQIFVCDSNIIRLPSNYGTFVNSLKNHAMIMETGYYKGDDDNIYQEMRRSLGGRWDYDSKCIERSTKIYMSWLEADGIDYRTLSVGSMKYLGWNVEHEKKRDPAGFIFSQGNRHLQGNIIVSMLPVLYPNDVKVFRSLNNDVLFSPHLYSA